MAIALLTMGVFNSCSKDEAEVDEEITAADMAKIKSTVEAGDWMITSYVDSENDETTEYVGYVFNFNVDGTLGATNGSVSVSGAWSLAHSDDDSANEDVDFNIFFTTPDLFEELADDWIIVKYSTTKIELKNLNDTDASLDYLTFEKL